MSTSWDVYCKNCSEQCGIDNAEGSFGHDLIRDLIEHRHALAAAVPMLEGTGLTLKLNMQVWGIDPSWFVKHHEHRLAPINEYGDVQGDVCHSCKRPEETRELVVDRERLGRFCQMCRDSLIKILKGAIPP